MKISGKKIKIEAANSFELENKKNLDLLLAENGVELTVSVWIENISDRFYETIWDIWFSGLEFEEIDFEKETVRLI